MKLYEMIDKASTDEIICWVDEDNGFKILDIDRFSDEILPSYFKHNKFSSFIR